MTKQLNLEFEERGMRIRIWETETPDGGKALFTTWSSAYNYARMSDGNSPVKRFVWISEVQAMIATKGENNEREDETDDYATGDDDRTGDPARSG